MDEELDTLPTSQPLNDIDAIKRIIDAGPPDIHQGYGDRVLLGNIEAYLESVGAMGSHC